MVIIKLANLNLVLYLTLVHLHTFTQSSLSHSLFRENFTKSSSVHKRLEELSYDQPHCTTDHIRICFGKDEYGDRWIYIGEVKEGTDDVPHGIGIQVYSYGYTQQLDNKDK